MRDRADRLRLLYRNRAGPKRGIGGGLYQGYAAIRSQDLFIDRESGAATGEEYPQQEQQG